MTNKRNRTLKLGARVFGIGHYRTSWLHPNVPPDGNINFAEHIRQAQEAEAAKFDFIFFSDRLYFDEHSAPKSLNQFEPIALLSALASITKRIGLVGTLSTSYSEPFNVARQFMTLDKISGGRAGWNVVSTALSGASLNFSRDVHYGHAERYRRAKEYLDIVQGLWDSWEDDAFSYDKKNNIFYDPSKLHALNYEGEFFKVRGPLNINRSPQGQPVIFQAGQSEAGKQFAAQYAEGVYTTPITFEEANVFYKDLKERVVNVGREEDDILIFAGLNPVIGRTEDEAQAKFRDILSYITYEEALTEIKLFFKNVNLFQFDPDAPFPDLQSEGNEGYSYMANRIKNAAKQEGLTLRQAAFRYGTPKSQFVGTPVQIADRMQAWFEGRACDGFFVWPPYYEGTREFIDLVLPILRERGLFREEYEANTLRGNLGLDFVRNRYATT
ncbi:LLM class flavin-dependent oxidoreductase [Paenibacillus cymbidii]|uniref:LLM class flavin-dependent oxidoreductase n=1 Tax=Paenibacillus cymbidii TaxID=1639034 RepID=UPI001080187E|nr:LLM class flavin-dependent oxidoreductase [Paenibacillus cymbidii]